MRKVRLKVALVISGKHCPAGAEVEVKDTLARRLVALGQATFVVQAPATAADPAVTLAETSTAVPTNRRKAK